MRKMTAVVGVAFAALAWAGGVRAGEADALAKANQARAKAVKYLVSQVNADGTFGKSQLSPMPGIVGLALYALANGPGQPDAAQAAAMAKAAEYLLKCQMDNGAIALAKFGNENYNTSVAVLALKALNDPKYAAALEKAKAFILGCQLDEKKGYNKEEHFQAYGGFGYGKTMRPDLSNTAFALEALKEMGMKEDSKEFKNALLFVQRCQDNPETNDVPVMKGGDGTGAFQYLPGDSEACSEYGLVKTRSGKMLPKPYGSMTYQGVKCLIYCGETKDSTELRKAWEWIKTNYSVTEPPAGRGMAGYYYYVVAFAKAFKMSGMKELTLADGRKVSWAQDLAGQLVALQGQDGSFANKDPRWMETDPTLGTAYALIALNLAASELAPGAAK